MERADWVVTEKIHGAHFVILTNGLQVRFAKRGAILNEDDVFFGYQSIAGDLTRCALAAANILATKGYTTDCIAIHGELFGGSYPHVSVDALPGVRHVQSGIWYCPHISYIAFDIATFSQGTRAWLPFGTMRDVLTAAGLKSAEPLFIGSRTGAIAHSPRFVTRIPALLGLPPLEGNLAEGIVIKPASGLEVEGYGRPLIKIKNKEFSEVDDDFQKADASGDQISALAPLLAHLTFNRFAATRSKMGDNADEAELAVAVLDDAICELCLDPGRAAWVAELTPEALGRAQVHIADQLPRWAVQATRAPQLLPP